MNKQQILFTYIFILFGIISGNCQLGNLSKKLKDATKKESETAKPENEAAKNKIPEKPQKVEESKPANQEKTRARNIPQPATVDKNAKPASKIQTADMSSSVLSPAIAWYSLLDQDHLYYDASSGYFRPHGFHVFFLPEKDINGKPMNFAQFDSYYPPAMHMDVMDKVSGERKARFYYRAEPEILPAFKMKLDDRGTDPLYPAYVNLFEGKYDLKFYINENQFYTFPVTIEKVSNKDPYSPVKQLWFMRGEWEEWGRVEFNSDGDFIFSHYLPERDVKVTNQSKWDEQIQYPYTARLLRNGKVIGNFDAQSPQRTITKGVVSAENARWVRNQNPFYAYPPVNRRINDNHSHDYIYTRDITDGNYTIENEIYKPSGIVKGKYAFTVKDGKIISDPRADRSQYSDKLTVLEQGPNYFYIRKLKN